MTQPKAVYYPYFDYLRILLAVIVMLFHDGVVTWSLSGNLAVQVFFALSGWLIGGILPHLPAKELPRFYFNRAMRIWIPYYIALALLIAVSLLRDRLTGKWFEFIFYDFSFVYNLFGTQQLAQHVQLMPLQGTGNHFWSVNAEEQFYLVAPILLVLVAPKIGRSIPIWFSIALVAWFSNIYASIIFGVLAAVVVDHYGPIHSKRSVRYSLMGLTLTAFVGICIGLNYELLAPIFSIGVVLLLAVKGQQDQFGAFVGGMSYPLYLNHWIGVLISNALVAPFHLKGSVLQHILAVVAGLGIAAGLYWWVDRRIVIARGKLFSHKRGVWAMAIAYLITCIGIVGGLAIAKIPLN